MSHLDWPDYEVTPTCPCPFNEFCRTELQVGINRAIVAGMRVQECGRFETLARLYRAETDQELPWTAAVMWETLTERRALRQEGDGCQDAA